MCGSFISYLPRIPYKGAENHPCNPNFEAFGTYYNGFMVILYHRWGTVCYLANHITDSDHALFEASTTTTTLAASFALPSLVLLLHTRPNKSKESRSKSLIRLRFRPKCVHLSPPLFENPNHWILMFMINKQTPQFQNANLPSCGRDPRANTHKRELHVE